MSNTIYAAFNDASLAEKAAGALLDYGVRAEDISVVHSGTDGRAGATTTSHGKDVADIDSNVSGAYAGWDDSANRTNTGYTGTDIINPGGASGGAALNDISEMQTMQTTPMNMQGAVPSATAYGAIDDSTTYRRLDRENDPDYQANLDDDSDEDIEGAAKHGISTTSAADAGAGAIKGAGIGLGVGAVAALASVFLPGFGIVLGGGALAAALGGLAGATGAGAAAGAVTGYLKDQGIDERVAQNYDSAVSHGGALLAVQAPSGDVGEAQIRNVLDKYGASNVNSYATKGYLA